MGTVFSFDVRSPGIEGSALDGVVAWLHVMDQVFSTYRSDSDISRLRRDEITVPECAPEVAEALARCAELRDETDGYFDCGAGLDLDPSGYVKGWAIEQASVRLRAAGSVNHCIVGGGDVQCAGRAEADRPWGVAIADPLHRGEVIATVSGVDLAVATSGTAERGAHIVDPHTGTHPDALASLTVVGRRLADIDAYATAAFAMGARAADWLAARGLSALIVDRAGHVTRTGPGVGIDSAS
jgi:thiamine biosynthesis lipoprotein